jgi:hypothetical protein
VPDDWGRSPAAGRQASIAAEQIEPEGEPGLILDVLLAQMLGDGLIEVTPDRRLQATQRGNDLLLIADTYSVQRAIPGAEVTGWNDPQP